MLPGIEEPTSFGDIRFAKLFWFVEYKKASFDHIII
jgi:hypothetical protein